MGEKAARPSAVTKPGATAARKAGRRPWGRRALVACTTLLVLRATQAMLAAVAVLTVAAAHLARPAPRLRVTRLAEVRADPLAPVTALVMVTAAATLAAVLLSRRQPIVAFAGVKAFAVLVATTLASPLAGRDVAPLLAVAGCGAALVALLWSAARDAVVRVLAAAGLPHPRGRLADLAVAAKIAALVLLLVIPG
jgi:hypothetical protein